jgi:uncharacterized protein (DUF302 family)
MKAGLGKTLDLPFDEVVDRAEKALADEGFGILTQIDVKATLKKKLDVDVDRYLILGACNPPLAHRALSQVPEVGVFLPCNVVVREVAEGTRLEVMNAGAMADFFPGTEVESVAEEVMERMERVLSAV